MFEKFSCRHCRQVLLTLSESTACSNLRSFLLSCDWAGGRSAVHPMTVGDLFCALNADQSDYSHPETQCWDVVFENADAACRVRSAKSNDWDETESWKLNGMHDYEMMQCTWDQSNVPKAHEPTKCHIKGFWFVISVSSTRRYPNLNDPVMAATFKSLSTIPDSIKMCRIWMWIVTLKYWHKARSDDGVKAKTDWECPHWPGPLNSERACVGTTGNCQCGKCTQRSAENSWLGTADWPNAHSQLNLSKNWHKQCRQILFQTFIWESEFHDKLKDDHVSHIIAVLGDCDNISKSSDDKQ